MSLTTLLYIIDIFSKIDKMMGILIFLYIASFVISAFICAMTKDCYMEESHTYMMGILRGITKKYWIALILLGIITFIPSQKTMYLMVGAKYLQSSDIPLKVQTILNSKLDEYIKEVR